MIFMALSEVYVRTSFNPFFVFLSWQEWILLSATKNLAYRLSILGWRTWKWFIFLFIMLYQLGNSKRVTLMTNPNFYWLLLLLAECSFLASPKVSSRIPRVVAYVLTQFSHVLLVASCVLGCDLGSHLLVLAQGQAWWDWYSYQKCAASNAFTLCHPWTESIASVSTCFTGVP